MELRNSYYEPIRTRLHFDEVRNAWNGPETWMELENRPSVTWIDDSVYAVPRGYFKAYEDPLAFRSLYARWWRWPDVYVRGNAPDWMWRFLSKLGRAGLIHSVAAKGCVTRLRDLRFGRGVKSN